MSQTCSKCGGSGYGRLVAEEWKENAYAWRDLYRRLRDKTGEGDTGEVVRVEGQTRRLSDLDARQVLAALEGEEA